MTASSERYGDWHIIYDPPPIPFRNCDWHYWHDHFDGAEDAYDIRCGSAASRQECIDEIDDYELERTGSTPGDRVNVGRAA